MKENNIRVFSKIGESIYYNKNEDKLLEKKSRKLDLENVENSNKVIKDDNLCSCTNKIKKKIKK